MEEKYRECLEMVRSQLFDKNNGETILTLAIDKVLNIEYTYHVDVKNNISVPIKFVGTESEFNEAYSKYFDSDTYGKIIGVHKSEAVEDIIDDTVEDQYSPFYGQKKVKRNRWGEEIGLERKNVNKRYYRYL